jgi:hypothetical protein
LGDQAGGSWQRGSDEGGVMGNPKSRRLESLLKASKNTAIRRDAWDFSACPHPEQTEACFLYEYSLESESIKRAVSDEKEKFALHLAHEEEHKQWFRANPAPFDKAEHKAWCHRAIQEIPHVLLRPSLRQPLHFLTYCHHFPDKHWLKIPSKERKDIAKMFLPGRLEWGLGPAYMAKQEMIIQSLDQFLANLLKPWNFFPTTNPFPWCSGKHVFSFNWPRSNRMLLQDFKRWLEENRPEDQPSYESTSSGSSRKTSHKDLLKALAALRLLRSFKDNFEEARFHSMDAADRPLYSDQSAWRKAVVKAEQEIEHFEAAMIL